MQLIKMSYNGFTFTANPTSLKVNLSKNVATKTIPFGFGKSTEVCFEPAVVTGNGCFIGANARERAHELMRIFTAKGSSYLFAPSISPMRAFFTKLDISYNAGQDKIDYSFEFTQESDEKNNLFDFGYTYAKAGENLYDVANRTGFDVKELFERNDYGDLFSVCEGDKIWLS